MMQADPCVLTWLKWRAGTPLFDFCFFVKGKPAWGVHRPWRKISLRVSKGISQFLLNSIWTLPVVFKSLLAYWCHLALGIRDDIGSGNGLLHDGTKPLPEPMLTYRNSSPVTFFWGHLHKRYISYEIIQLASKLLTLIKFKYPRANELKHNAIIWTIIDFFFNQSLTNICGRHWFQNSNFRWKNNLKVSFAKSWCRPFCSGLNMLRSFFLSKCNSWIESVPEADIHSFFSTRLYVWRIQMWARKLHPGLLQMWRKWRLWRLFRWGPLTLQ